MGTEPVQTEIPMPEQPRYPTTPRLYSAIVFLRQKGYHVVAAGRDHVVTKKARWLVDDAKLMMLARVEGWEG